MGSLHRVPFPRDPSPISQEPLPEPTAAEIAREAEQEASVFSQAANVDRLLMMLRNMDPAKDNLADDEEIQVSELFIPYSVWVLTLYIQELYRSCMTLRPKIVKLIDKYSQKRGQCSSISYSVFLIFDS